ncbi:MAG: response regulator transcription factor [Lunatimonas sp.]|uniref:LytR/AlgR family response regulator transcription factor n=1 Tax=Lunatimonas sp. TaxID=2060141 RepID=UPI00263A95AD|nr:LytTR family DNA-binding domain-containing protein [Lunatimonas sp.]MCC5937925.1 response regulator transcription factor [Lunatimonas sp.]
MAENTKTKCIIVEDEPLSAARLAKLLELAHADEFEIAEVVLTADRVSESIQFHLPELVFLDVKLNDTDAFSLLKELGTFSFQVVFTSGHREYAPNAFRIDAVDYLLKPIDARELAQAIEKFRRRRHNQRDHYEAGLLEQLTVVSGDKKIPIHTFTGIEMVPVREIVHCAADANYTHLFLRSGEKLTVSRTLKEFESLLGKMGFFRVHHSHLVNLREVKAYNRGKGGVLVLSDKSEIEVSVRRREALLQALKGM